MLRLYDYWRSSAVFRVRIALNLKGVAYERLPIDLYAGDQHEPSYRDVNPQSLIPALGTGEGVITQSMAILEWLDEVYPAPPLLPQAPLDRARVRAMTYALATDVHALQNFRTLNHLRKALAMPEEQVMAWARHWVDLGFEALQTLIARSPVQGRYCHGDAITLADIVLVPQLGNARRFGCDLTRYERLLAIEAALRDVPAVAEASPEAQSRAT